MADRTGTGAGPTRARLWPTLWNPWGPVVDPTIRHPQARCRPNRPLGTLGMGLRTSTGPVTSEIPPPSTIHSPYYHYPLIYTTTDVMVGTQEQPT